MDQLCDWLVCIGILVSLGLAIAILVKQNKCCSSSAGGKKPGEPYSLRNCYPCPSCKQAKKMLASKLCQSTECKRYPNSPNCIDCKQALEVMSCQCCKPTPTKEGFSGSVDCQTLTNVTNDILDYVDCKASGQPCIKPSNITC
jgi:hypothetical protein